MINSCNRVFLNWQSLEDWLNNLLPEQASNILQQANQETDPYKRFIEFEHNNCVYTARIWKKL